MQATTGPSTEEGEQHVLIVGAGIMGLSTAYYLQHNHGIASTLIDTTGRMASAASGKAGGFLALDWNDGTAIEALTRRSFVLHQELADTFGADTIQYRLLDCATIAGNGGGVSADNGCRTLHWFVPWVRRIRLRKYILHACVNNYLRLVHQRL